ncbi:MAG: hypothetical protein ACPG4N_07095 [Gammaproteobacteria bacterium]
MNTPNDETPALTLAPKIAELCKGITPVPFHADLIAGVNDLSGDLHFRWILSRGGWYRLGGVIDADGNHVAESLEKWLTAQQEAFNDDLDEFLDEYRDRGYRVTHLEGDSHYLTATTGKGAAEFLQLEVEEVQEVPVRPLIAEDWEPDDWQELIDPMDLENNPDELSQFPRRYLFRRLTPIPEFLASLGEGDSNSANLRRMIRDWDESTAAKTEHFCDHWALGIRDQLADGKRLPQARILTGDSVELHCHCSRTEPWKEGELAACIRRFDHDAGYSFAWFFHMIASKHVGSTCALVVMNEHQGEYAYVPQRDLKLLEAWLDSPYRA